MRPADHGAVAAIMPTGMSTTSGQHIFNNAIFEQVFTNDQRTIGDALLSARLTLLANTGADYQLISFCSRYQFAVSSIPRSLSYL